MNLLLCFVSFLSIFIIRMAAEHDLLELSAHFEEDKGDVPNISAPDLESDDDGLGPSQGNVGQEMVSRGEMAFLSTEYRFDDGYDVPFDRRAYYGKDLQRQFYLGSDCPVAEHQPKRFQLAEQVSTYNRTEFERALEASWEAVRKKPKVTAEPIWESNPFLAPILGRSKGWQIGGSLDNLRVSSLGLTAQVESNSSLNEGLAMVSLRDRATFEKALGRLKKVKWNDSEDYLRQKVIGRLVGIVSKYPEHFQIGRLMLLDLVGHEESKHTATIGDVVVGKATKTMLARSGAIISYISYCAKAELKPFPMNEAQCYRYVTFLRESGAAPTKAQSFRSAVGFLIGTLGADGAKEVYESERIKGAVMSQTLKKGPTKRRRTLTAFETAWLEYLVSESPDLYDRNMAGFVLFLLYGRARNADTSDCRSFFADFSNRNDYEGFVQVDIGSSKTGRTVQKRNEFLPLVAPRAGIRKLAWADGWVEARKLAGLHVDGAAKSSFPLMPIPNLSGGWGDRPLSASEVRKWMVELLRMNDPKLDCRLLGSHSGKATGLSWMAKIGASPHIRKLLGYHVDSQDVTMATYSRDLSAEPLRQFAKMISAIKQGLFLPDESRGGTMRGSLKAVGFERWYPGLVLTDREQSRAGDDFDEYEAFERAEFSESDKEQESEKPKKNSVEVEPDQEHDCGQELSTTSDSDSSSSAESSDADALVAGSSGGGEQGALLPLMGCTVDEVESGLMYFHNTFTTMHKLRSADSTVFVCSRILKLGYSKVVQPMASWPKCKQCFPVRHGL